MPQNFSPSSKMLFLSDVHLGMLPEAENRKLEQNLIQLIDFAEAENYRIAVLGDLFDYWIEYPDFIPDFGEKVLQRFRNFHQKNEASLYITGNHDNWTLGHFADCGFDVEPNYRILNINNCRVLLLHGDAIGDHPENLQRPLFHRIIRDKTFLRFYRGLLSPQKGLYVMKIFSEVSRFSGKQTDPETLSRWAKNMLRDHDIDVVLCGHDHVPRARKYDYGTYINLGNFQQHHSLVEYNKGRFLLVEWNSSQGQLLPFQNETFA